MEGCSYFTALWFNLHFDCALKVYIYFQLLQNDSDCYSVDLTLAAPLFDLKRKEK